MDPLDRICSYSILLALHEQGYDFVDCLVPIVVQFVPDFDYTDTGVIRHDLAAFIDLPELTIKKILARARDDGLIEQEGHAERFKLVRSVAQKLLDQRESVRRRMETLENNMYSYFINHGFVPGEPIWHVIEGFIQESAIAADFVLPSRRDEPIALRIEKRATKMLLQYLRDRDHHKDQVHIGTFKEIVMGSIVARAFEWTDISNIKVESYRSCKVFLDTNFLFSVLEFHDEIVNRPALELLNGFLKLFNFQLKVFDFTIAQVRRVLLGYHPDQTAVFTEEIRGPSVHGTLRKRGWTEKDVEDYLKTLPEELAARGIEIVSTALQLTPMGVSKDKGLAALLDSHGEGFKRYKRSTDEFGLLHDIAAISMVRRSRGDSPVSLNDPKAFFLTSDHRLTEFCQVELGHKESATLSEVVLDMSFASLLWFLQKGRDRMKLSLDTVIAGYSRTLFVSEAIWERFRVVFDELLSETEYDAQRIPHIFYINIQNILNEFPKEKACLITRQFLENKIVEARNTVTEQTALYKEYKQIIQEGIETIEKQSERIRSLSDDCRQQKELLARLSLRVRILAAVLAGLAIVISLLLLWILSR